MENSDKNKLVWPITGVDVSISDRDFEEQMIYVVALAPQSFYKWARSLRNKVKYEPKWIKIKGLKVETTEEKYEAFINVLGILIEDFIEPIVHLRYLKWLPYP